MTVNVTPKTQTIENGQDNDATIVEQEFTELYTNDSILAQALNAITDDPFTFTDTTTFSGGLNTDTINEITTDAGVTVDGTILKNGYANLYSIRSTISSVDTATETITTPTAHGISSGSISKLRAFGAGSTLPGGTSAATIYYLSAPTVNTLRLHTTQANAIANTSPVNLTSAGSGVRQIIAIPSAPIDGDVWMIDGLYYRSGGATQKVLTSADFPKGYINGKAVNYTSSTSITIPAGMRLVNSTNNEYIEFASNQVVSTGSTGAGALDTGTVGTNKWLYLYAIKQAGGTVSAVLSATNESVSGSITFPANYSLKRQFPFALRIDGSGLIIPFQIGEGWPYRPSIYYTAGISYFVSGVGVTASPTNVVLNAVDTVDTTVDASAFIPPASRQFYPSVLTSGRPSSYVLRETGTTPYNFATGDYNGGNTYSGKTLGVNASQQFDYKGISVSGALTVDVAGFLITEIQ